MFGLNRADSTLYRSRFNPSESLAFKDVQEMVPNGTGLTMSHFSKHEAKKKQMLPGKTNRSPNASSRQFPTYPNHNASGLVRGQKIAIKNKPNSYNIVGEFNLRTHFLNKLQELRSMKEEYYRAPGDQTNFSKRGRSVQAMGEPTEETNSAKPWSNCKP